MIKTHAKKKRNNNLSLNHEHKNLWAVYKHIHNEEEDEKSQTDGERMPEKGCYVILVIRNNETLVLGESCIKDPLSWTTATQTCQCFHFRCSRSFFQERQWIENWFIERKGMKLNRLGESQEEDRPTFPRSYTEVFTSTQSSYDRAQQGSINFRSKFGVRAGDHYKYSVLNSW